MGNINVGRWLAGGFVAGLVMWIIEGAASMLYMEDAVAALAAHNLSMEMTPAFWALTCIMSLLMGLATVLFYALARTRLGAGPKTAIIVGIVAYFGYILPVILGYMMIDLYPRSMLHTWAVIGFFEMIVVSLAGAWVYKE